MQNFQLNVIRKIDAASLAHIHQHSFDKGWSTKDIESYLDRERCYGLWFESAAFILFEVVENECEIKTLAVMPDNRRQQLAETLCQQMTLLCGELGVKKIFLEVSEKNEAAQGLYEKLGYSEINRRKDYYGKDEDALMLALVL